MFAIIAKPMTTLSKMRLFVAFARCNLAARNTSGEFLDEVFMIAARIKRDCSVWLNTPLIRVISVFTVLQTLKRHVAIFILAHDLHHVPGAGAVAFSDFDIHAV